MRDPRLLEIDFLMSLDRAGQARIRSTMSLETSGVERPGSKLDLFGASVVEFRDLSLYMLRQGLVSDFATRSRSHYVTPNRLAEKDAELVEQLIAGQPILIHITHAGRLRLWDLRDALMRDPDLEPFGLRSKAAWERDLPVSLRWAGADDPLSIIFVDLDAFGRVNKELGHSVGDEVLRATFKVTKSVVGARGHVYRWGGEEIGALLPRMALEQARALAEELRSLIEVEVQIAVPVLGRAQTASIGVGTFTHHVEPRVAFDHVDGLEKEAKTTGKNKVVARAFSAEKGA